MLRTRELARADVREIQKRFKKGCGYKPKFKQLLTQKAPLLRTAALIAGMFRARRFDSDVRA